MSRKFISKFSGSCYTAAGDGAGARAYSGAELQSTENLESNCRQLSVGASAPPPHPLAAISGPETGLRVSRARRPTPSRSKSPRIFLRPPGNLEIPRENVVAKYGYTINCL